MAGAPSAYRLTTAPGDVAAIESLLDGRHLDYATANSWQLNRMSEAQLHEYRLLMVPGGNFVRPKRPCR